MGVLDGKVVLITGAARGIGREVALLAAREGARLVLNDVGCTPDGSGVDADPVIELAAAVHALGGEAVTNAASVTDPSAVQDLFTQAMDSYGALDAVINPAGILRDSMFHRMSAESWDIVIDVHLRGSFNIARATIEHFRSRRDGAFVFFSSNAGLMGNIGQANYAAAKMGVVGFSRVLAMEGASHNIRSNVIAPVAWTRLAATVRPRSDELARSMRRMQETLDPARVAPLAVALVAPDAASVSGQIFMARGDDVMLVSQPRPLDTITRADGWTAAELLDEGFKELGLDRYAISPSQELFPGLGF